MIHYQQAITNTKGDALIGYFVKLADTSDDSAIPLYADSALTPIVSVSGADDACLVDSDGMADFWVGDGTYHMDIYATDGTTLVRRETFVQFGVPAADYGDVTVNDDGTWTVDAVSGTVASAFGLSLIDDASASAARTTLGLGTAATQSTGTFAQVANNLSDLASAPTARANLGLHAVTTQSGTSYTAVLGDADSMIRFTNASAVTFTIPPNSSVAFPTGSFIEIVQAGAGAVSVAAGSGVTINSRASDLTLAGQYAVAFVKKVDTDTWIMNGDL